MHETGVGAWSQRVRQGRLVWAAYCFRSARADYYDYLADLMAASLGRKTLRDMFRDDAVRYGPASVRGMLSAHWAQAFQESGGDLFLTWQGTLPGDEINMLRAAQYAGEEALRQTLRDLARVARMLDRARRETLTTLAAGIVACTVLLGLLIAVPFYTVPQLLRTFSGVPPDHYGALSQALLRLADTVRGHGIALLCMAGGVVWSIVWSLRNLTGPVRTRLDGLGIWRLYRDFQAMRFLAMLAVLVRPRGHDAPRLREAVRQLLHAGSSWHDWHLARILARIDGGVIGPDTFDTGLIDRETWWYMADVIATRGMDEGMQLTRTRLETHAMRTVVTRAQTLHWLMLLAALAALLGLAFWHYGVVDEMRRALLNFHSGY